MAFSENFILYEMKKGDDLKIVSEEQIPEYIRNGYKKGKKVNVGGKK